ncbi:hypothetical protein BD770DRAFT_399522 [Pilaira anomala]|nr:hypothetical protein BD770DRAFT_399522 [Pilaira anomala]
MVFWKDIVGIFNHKKNKQARTVMSERQQVNESETQPSTSSTQAEAAEAEAEEEEEEVLPTTPVVVNHALPEVEFEESRNLLQLDFFGSGQDHAIASFPKFDYLLQDNNKKTQSIEKKPRKSSTLLRHKLSLYKPGQKTVKRSVSTPDIYNSR